MPRRPQLGLLALLAGLVLLGPGSSRAADPVLTGTVGTEDAFVISLADAGGACVSHVAAGTYTLVIHDASAMHDFHLRGPGVDVTTEVEFVGAGRLAPGTRSRCARPPALRGT